MNIRYFLGSMLLLSFTLSGCAAGEMASSNQEGVTPPPSEYDLLTLEKSDPVCTQEPMVQLNAMTGQQEELYPVHLEYSRLGDDRYQILGLFTAAACGEGRVEEFFNDQTWSDYSIRVNAEGGANVQLQKAMDDLGFERLPDSPTDGFAHFLHVEAIDAQSLLKLRPFAPYILGSDCTVCG